MNKKLSLALALGLFTISPALIAQDSTYIANEYTKALALYNQAQKYNDIEMTRQALFELLVLNDQDSTVLRTLGELYYNNRQFTSSALVALDFLEKYPDNLIALEMAALSFEQIGLYDRAIEYYKSIWIDTGNIRTLYQIAYLEYSTNKFESALENLNVVEQNIGAEETITLNTSAGQTQEVLFKAVVLNLRALIAVGLDRTEEAKNLVNQALELAPDFEGAKRVLESLNE